MKKIVSIILAALMLAAMLSVFAVPAFAEGEKQTVKIPSDVSMHYTGEELTAFEDNDIYTVEHGKRKDCGGNYVDLSLRDTDKYKWEGTDGKSITVFFEVHQYFDRDKNGFCDNCGKADHLVSFVDYLEKKVNSDNTVTSEEKTRNIARVVSKEDSVWGSTGGTTWYVVDESVELENRPVVKGDVHIILKNETTLTANKGITVEKGNSISFYSQTDEENKMGKLRIATTEENNSAGVTAIGGRNGSNGNSNFDTRYVKSGGAGGNAGDAYFYGGDILLKSSGAVCIGGGNGGKGGNLLKEEGGLTNNAVDGHAGNGGNGGNSGTIYFYAGKVLLNSDIRCIGGGNGDKGGICEKGCCYNRAYNGSDGKPGSFAAEDDLIVYGTPVMKAGESAESTTILSAVTDYTNQPYLSVQYNTVSFIGSVLSNGNVWIIAAVAVIVLGGIAALVIVKKKKKTA